MAEPSHAAAFCAAVATLHGSSDARAREEADRWLVSATTGAAAWDTCLPVLLAGPAVSPEARVVAASALARALRAGAFEGRLEEALSAARAAFSVAGDEPATSAAASALLAAAAIEADRETASLLDDGSRRDFVLCRGLVREAAARLVSGEAVGQPALPASPAALARLVAALAQEAPRLPATHRRVLARALGGVSREALATFEAARGAASLSFVAGALEAWAQACTDDGFPQSAAVAGASVLRASAPGLWNDLKQAALSPGSPSNDAAAAAAALVEAVRADATQSEEGSSSSAGADLAACVAAARATVAAREDEALAAAVSRVGSAIGDAWPEQCCTNEAQGIAATMLECVRWPNADVVEPSLEYFLSLNTVPLGERAEWAKKPLFAALLEAVVVSAAVPADEDLAAERDDEEWARLRDGALTEALEDCSGMLSGGYLSTLASAAAGSRGAPGGAQLLESTLWAAAVVARRLGSGAAAAAAAVHDAPVDASVQPSAADAAALRQLVGVAFADGAAPLLAWSPLGVAAARLVGSYASWLAADRSQPFVPCLSVLLSLLESPDSTLAAATATRQICAAASPRLGVFGEQGIATLGALAQVVAAPPRAALVRAPEGASAGPRGLRPVRLLAIAASNFAGALPGDEAPKAALALLTSGRESIGRQLEAVVHSAPNDPAVAEISEAFAGSLDALGAMLEVFAATLRAPQAWEVVGPVVAATASQASTRPEAAESLVDVTLALLDLDDADAIAPAAFSALGGLATAAPGCGAALRAASLAAASLTAVGRRPAVPESGTASGEDVASQHAREATLAALGAFLSAAVSELARRLPADGSSPSPEDGELLCAALRASTRVAVASPDALRGVGGRDADAVPSQLAALALAALRSREPDELSAAVAYLAAALGAVRRPILESAKLTAATTQHAVALQLAPLLFASAKSLPQESLRNAAACLAASLGGPGREDTLRYLQAWEGLPRDVREAVASRASEVETGIVASSIANRARAVAMLRDVLAVGKGIEDPEVLLAYRLS